VQKLVGDPILLFDGEMDTLGDQDTGDTTTLVLNIESKLLDLERPREQRYTHQNQQALFAGDKGLESVADIQDKIIEWKA